MKITHIQARTILDSRGTPTVEADVTLEGGVMGRAAVPSGASTGSREAVELRDGGSDFGGRGVTKAVQHVNDEIAKAFVGQDAQLQEELDQRLRELDGTPTKARLGANAILAVSLAAAKAVALARSQPLYRYIAELGHNEHLSLPLPMMNILNGGQHASGSTDIQEMMIVPVGAKNIYQAVQIGTEIFHTLGRSLKSEGYATTVGDEGGYAPALAGDHRKALDMIMTAIEKAGYKPGRDVALALDVAATELVSGQDYQLDDRTYGAGELIQLYGDLSRDYPIVSIEDGLGEDDWAGWIKLTAEFGGTLQLVGDDLLVTNTALLEKAIKDRAANAILIKPNQIGTLSETIAAVKMAQAAGWRTVISHRSGETEDTTIAHLAVGLGAGQIKTGSLSRADRTAKYNELMRIAEDENLALAKPFI